MGEKREEDKGFRVVDKRIFAQEERKEAVSYTHLTLPTKA